MRGSQADAKRCALRLINYRPRSRREMLQRLAMKGFDDSEITAVMEFLIRSGLINDELLAEGLLRHAVEKKHLGRRGIELFLYKRGIEKELIAKTLSSHTEDNEKETAAMLAEKRISFLRKHPKKVIKRRLYGMLQRRGFRPDIIFNTVNALFK